MNYQLLTKGRRYQISALLEQGISISKIAKTVKCHRSTLYRELRLAYIQRCRDPESSNLEFEPPRIVTVDTELRIDKVNATLGHDNGLGSETKQSVGEALFYQRCTMCHSAKDPKQYTKAQWRGITKSMFPRAGLTPLEREEVMSFLEANAKDAQ